MHYSARGNGGSTDAHGPPFSALSLRVFGEDITVAGRQASSGKRVKSKPNEDAARETPVPETETDPEGAKGTPD